MAAKNPLLVDIFDLGTPKSCQGEVARLLAKGQRIQRLKEAAKKTILQQGSNHNKPFLWS